MINKKKRFFLNKTILYQIKPENVLMCVDEEHIRALAFQAAEWHKLGVQPLGSAGKIEFICIV